MPSHDSSIELSSDLLGAVFGDSAGRGELPRGTPARPAPPHPVSLPIAQRKGGRALVGCLSQTSVY